MRRFMMVLGALGVLVACGGDDASESDGASGDQSAIEAQDDPTTSTTTATTAPPPPRIVYEIDGNGTVPVDYGIAGNRSQQREVTLPWSEEQVQDPSQISMLVALVGSQGDVTCRIRRGDEVLDQQTLSSDRGPLLSCAHPPSGQPQVTFPPGM